MAKIKYLGTADRVVIKKGEKFAGRLADATTKDLVWDADNNHLIDSDEAGLSAEAVELLLEDTARFKDVTDLKRIPSSLNEQIFRGHKASVAADGAADVEETVDETPNAASTTRPGRAVRGGQSVEGGTTVAGTAPVGGSTATS